MKLPRPNWWLIFILGLVILLRIPSWFEPHWYGDEEIYLALGQAMRRGAVLYRDIWDNKTPLLYLIYSISPTLLWAKLTATLAVLGTTVGTYFLSKKFFEDRPVIYCLLPTVLVGILLSLPILEGTIANAELYFTLPIVLAAYLLFTNLITNHYSLITSVLVGLLMSAAFLLKVPAIFDFVGLLLAFSLTRLLDEFSSPTKNYQRFLAEQIKTYFPLVLSFVVPVGLVFLYFFASHALTDFITAAFKQNVNYVAIDSGLFQKLTNPLYIKGASLLLGIALVTWAYFKKIVSKEFVLLSSWFGFSLYGALLSNRPYKHYLLQIAPPAVVLLVYLWAHFRRYIILNTVYVILLLWIAKTFYFAFALNPLTYYPNFFAWASERKQWENYINYFDGRTANDYRVAQYISQNTKEGDPIFVWGDMASIYTISGRPAATKFIQAHHLTTINPKNYDLIINRLLTYQPKFIVVTRPVIFNFAALETLLRRNYKEVEIVGNLYVYRNITPLTPPAWKASY